MIDPLSRRLRVRDDGTGKSREEDGTFAEFEGADAIVLLGDPVWGRQHSSGKLPKEVIQPSESFSLHLRL